MEFTEITITELEQLVAEYHACTLSRADEQALRKLLATSPAHSPVLDECRLLMGLENILRKPDVNRNAVHKCSPYITAAASIAIVLAAGLSLQHTMFRQDCTQTEYIAYIHGHKIQDPAEAKAIVERDRERSMAMMNETLQSVQARKSECVDMINQLLDSTNN